jgi:hypothetical protein
MPRAGRVGALNVWTSRHLDVWMHASYASTYGTLRPRTFDGTGYGVPCSLTGYGDAVPRRETISPGRRDTVTCATGARPLVRLLEKVGNGTFVQFCNSAILQFCSVARGTRGERGSRVRRVPWTCAAVGCQLTIISRGATCSSIITARSCRVRRSSRRRSVARPLSTCSCRACRGRSSGPYGVRSARRLAACRRRPPVDGVQTGTTGRVARPSLPRPADPVGPSAGAPRPATFLV